jgi:hypothetical protein
VLINVKKIQIARLSAALKDFAHYQFAKGKKKKEIFVTLM